MIKTSALQTLESIKNKQAIVKEGNYSLINNIKEVIL